MLLKKTVYLREEDLELWESCPNKSLLVHNALRLDWAKETLQTIPPIVIKSVKVAYTPKKKLDNMVLAGEAFETIPAADYHRSDPVPTPVHFQKFDEGYCKHGLNLKVSKCKYGCK